MVIDLHDAGELKDLIETEDFLVVKFTAPSWCIPCQRFAPHYEAAAQSSSFHSDMMGRVTYAAVDIDHNDWAQHEYGIQGIPTVMLFAGGQYIKNLSERTAPKLMSEIRSAIQ